MNIWKVFMAHLNILSQNLPQETKESFFRLSWEATNTAKFRTVRLSDVKYLKNIIFCNAITYNVIEIFHSFGESTAFLFMLLQDNMAPHSPPRES